MIVVIVWYKQGIITANTGGCGNLIIHFTNYIENLLNAWRNNDKFMIKK